MEMKQWRKVNWAIIGMQIVLAVIGIIGYVAAGSELTVGVMGAWSLALLLGVVLFTADAVIKLKERICILENKVM